MPSHKLVLNENKTKQKNMFIRLAFVLTNLMGIYVNV